MYVSRFYTEFQTSLDGGRVYTALDEWLNTTIPATEEIVAVTSLGEGLGGGMRLLVITREG